VLLTARYERIFESLAEGVWQIDAAGSTSFMNERMGEMLGYPVDQSIGRSLLSFVPASQHGAVRSRLASCERGRGACYELDLLRKDGSVLSATIRAMPLFNGAGAYEGALAIVTDESERLRADDALRASEARYRALFESSPFPKWVYDVETLRFLTVNDACVRHYGYAREELLAMTVADICPDEVPALEKAVATGDPSFEHPNPWKHRKKDGTIIDVEVSWCPNVIDGRATRMAVMRDVTDRTRLEAQLRQAQKMEAIGSLAGGIAHDFNNLLSVILSYVSLASEAAPPGSVLRDDLDEIRHAGERAADLTRQLLAFSRQQVLRPRLVDVGRMVADMEKMLRRILGDDVALLLRAPEVAAIVNADPSQIEQIVMNLAVNARDALIRGGELAIGVEHVELGTGSAIAPDAPAGSYVSLRVADTGTGMDAATLARIFEPFFTTKETGRGTGLGLSTVFGIVRQSGGHIAVESSVGEGTSFTVLLPRVPGGIEAATDSGAALPTLVGSETVLLVEDDEQVRGSARSILRRSGYDVIEAANGGEALLICEQLDRRIDVLLTDVVMPRMSGRQLARRLSTVRPEMRVICMTGYAPDVVAARDVSIDDATILQKPFTPDSLLRAMRDVLRCSGCARC
jgi:PAS domain S-box-containing protein